MGLLAPFNPKEVGSSRKYWRFPPVRREDLLTVFSASANLKLLRDGRESGSCRCRLPERPLIVKIRLERPAGRDKRKIKIIFPLIMAQRTRSHFKSLALPQMDKSFHLRHFGENHGGGFDFLAVFM